MPEDVPADIRQANLLSSRLQDLLLNDACIVAAASDVEGKTSPFDLVPFKSSRI